MSKAEGYFKELRLGSSISELPKSKLPASAATENGKYPFICSSSELKYTDGYLQDKPAVVMGTGGTASVNFGRGEFAYSTDTWAIRSNTPEVDTEFLFRKIQQLLPLIDYVAFEGSGLKHLRKEFVKKLLIEVPSTPEISSKIISILATIDHAIEKTEALIEKHQQIKAGLMHDLFTRGIGADGQLRPPREQAPDLYQHTPIGWIPKDWHPLKLKDILKDSGGYLQTGPFGSQLHAHEYTFEGVPVVMPQDINDGKVDEISIARITVQRAHSLLKHRLKVGDIIIARRGELSRAAAIGDLEQGWVCGTGCFLLRLGGSNLDARFFSHMYRHATVQRQVAGLAVGTTMPSLNNEIMGKLIFPYMNQAEQSAIADKVDLTENRITTLQSELIKLQKQKSGLMHDLLTGKVSVKLDSQTSEMAGG